MSIKDSKILWFSISTAIIAGLIYLADVSKFIESLKDAWLPPLVPALLLGILVLVVWGTIWHRVFRASGIETSYFKTIRIFVAGNFMNSITPLGQAGGEPFMAYILQKNSDASYEKALSSIFSADLLNFTPWLTFTLGSALYLAIFRSVNDLIIQGAFLALAGTVIGGLLVYFLWFRSGTIEHRILHTLENLAGKLGRGEEKIEKLEKKLENVAENFQTIGKDPIYLVKTSIVSHVAFVMQITNYFLLTLALGISAPLTSITFIVAFSGLSQVAPTPGGSGAYEAVMATLTAAFIPGASFATGVTIGILFRLTTYWPSLLIGYISLNTLEK